MSICREFSTAAVDGGSCKDHVVTGLPISSEEQMIQEEKNSKSLGLFEFLYFLVLCSNKTPFIWGLSCQKWLYTWSAVNINTLLMTGFWSRSPAALFYMVRGQTVYLSERSTWSIEEVKTQSKFHTGDFSQPLTTVCSLKHYKMIH